ncbi:MAG: hypothetical protein ACXVSA_19535 [Solirubrobacteraceae bacterium]
MQAELDRDHVSHRDAAARLRYMADVQQRARRAALTPSFALVALGTIAVCHGLLATLWPHARALSVLWVAALVAVRPGLRVLRRHHERRRGLESSARLRLACAAGAAAFLAVAVVIGADPLVTALAATTALAAYLGGMPAVAVAALGVGVVGDVMIGRGLAPATGQIIVGVGLLAAGLMSLARERERA